MFLGMFSTGHVHVTYAGKVSTLIDNLLRSSFKIRLNENIVELTMKEAKAVTTVLSHLPDSIQGYWLNISQIHAIVKHGGFPHLPRKVIKDALRSTRSDVSIQHDRFRNKRYLSFVASTPL